MKEIHSSCSFEELSKLAWIKRFYERYRGDAKFRKRFRKDLRGTVNAYRITLGAEEVRRLWDPEVAGKIDGPKLACFESR